MSWWLCVSTNITSNCDYVIYRNKYYNTAFRKANYRSWRVIQGITGKMWDLIKNRIWAQTIYYNSHHVTLLCVSCLSIQRKERASQCLSISILRNIRCHWDIHPSLQERDSRNRCVTRNLKMRFPYFIWALLEIVFGYFHLPVIFVRPISPRGLPYPYIKVSTSKNKQSSAQHSVFAFMRFHIRFSSRIHERVSLSRFFSVIPEKLRNSTLNSSLPLPFQFICYICVYVMTLSIVHTI
jgi:hypothetical protein